MYRHWDTWEDGKFSHIFLSDVNDTAKKDFMPGEPYDCPQKPFGGDEDYVWNPDGKHIVYVTKKKQEQLMPSAPTQICMSIMLKQVKQKI